MLIRRMRTTKALLSAETITMIRMPYLVISYARMRQSSQVIMKVPLAQVIATSILLTSLTKAEGTEKIAIMPLQSM